MPRKRINPEKTGDESAEFLAFINSQRPAFGFISVQVDELSKRMFGATPEQRLSPSAIIVLNYLLCHMEFQNKVRLEQVQIGKILDINTQTINRVIGELEKRKIIARMIINNKYKGLIINPDIAMKGKSTEKNIVKSWFIAALNSKRESKNENNKITIKNNSITPIQQSEFSCYSDYMDAINSAWLVWNDSDYLMCVMHYNAFENCVNDIVERNEIINSVLNCPNCNKYFISDF